MIYSSCNSKSQRTFKPKYKNDCMTDADQATVGHLLEIHAIFKAKVSETQLGYCSPTGLQSDGVLLLQWWTTTSGKRPGVATVMGNLLSRNDGTAQGLFSIHEWCFSKLEIMLLFKSLLGFLP